MADIPDDSPLSRLLSIGRAASLLNLSENSVYRFIASGKLAAIKHGGTSWISRTEIDDYFARLESEAGKRRVEKAKAARPRRRSGAEAIAG